MALKGSDKPTRRIGVLHSSVGGRVRTEDGKTILAESSLEQQWITVLEYERTVREVSSQPLKVERVTDGLKRATHPDIKAVFQSVQGPEETVIYEVKGAAKLKKDWATLKPKLRSVMKHCRERGWRFKLITERLIETPYVRNAVFLRQYRRYKDDPELAALGQVISNALYAEGESTPRALLEILFLDPEQRTKALPALWMLVATGFVHVDMIRPLGFNSAIYIHEHGSNRGNGKNAGLTRPEQLAKASAAYAAQAGWIAVLGRPSAEPGRTLDNAQGFMRFDTGSLVGFEGRGYRITGQLSADSVLGEDLEDQTPRRLRVHDLVRWSPPKPALLPNNDKEISARDLQTYSQEEWASAKERLNILKPLLANPQRTRSDALVVAQEAGKGIATIYRWLNAYEDSGRLTSLVPQARGRLPGRTYLTRVQETIIDAAIQDKYTGKRGSAQAVIEAVLIACRKSGQRLPSPQVIQNRIDAIHPRDKLKAQGKHDIARNLFTAIKGQYPDATFVLAVVQIDHTPLDLEVVDPQFFLPLGRPWLTLAICVHSRMIVGLYLSMDAPSSTSIGMCLANAVNAKIKYLEDLGVPGDWPVWGKPALIHSDNGPDFRSGAVERACEEHGIDHKFRPVRQPQYGGHIERLMGTMATEIRKAPGATYSNVAEKQGHDPEASAALTLAEAERRIVDWIVNVYHNSVHNEIQMPPVKKWTQGIVGTKDQPGRGILPLPQNPERFALDFLPMWKRTVQPYGILLDHIYYYDRALDPWINAPDPDNERKKRKFIVRRDPRNISYIYFYDPERKTLLTVNYRNMGHPPMSEWELKRVLRQLSEEGRSNIDETLIFEALERIRLGDERAIQRSKKARRMAYKNPARAASGSPQQQDRATSSPTPAPTPRMSAEDPQRGLERGDVPPAPQSIAPDMDDDIRPFEEIE